MLYNITEILWVCLYSYGNGHVHSGLVGAREQVVLGQCTGGTVLCENC